MSKKCILSAFIPKAIKTKAILKSDSNQRCIQITATKTEEEEKSIYLCTRTYNIHIVFLYNFVKLCT